MDIGNTHTPQNRKGNNIMSFSVAIELIKKGFAISREAWDNVEVYLFLDNDTSFTEPIISHHIDDRCIPANLTHEDLLSEDWFIVE